MDCFNSIGESNYSTPDRHSRHLKSSALSKPCGHALSVSAETPDRWTRPATTIQKVTEMLDNRTLPELATTTAEDLKHFEQHFNPAVELDGTPITKSEEQDGRERWAMRSPQTMRRPKQAQTM